MPNWGGKTRPLHARFRVPRGAIFRLSFHNLENLFQKGDGLSKRDDVRWRSFGSPVPTQPVSLTRHTSPFGFQSPLDFLRGSVRGVARERFSPGIRAAVDFEAYPRCDSAPKAL